MIQHFTSERFGAVVFIDRRETIQSAKAHPRDIQIVKGEDCPALREEIAVDIRIGQGVAQVGAARNLIH